MGVAPRALHAPPIVPRADVSEGAQGLPAHAASAEARVGRAREAPDTGSPKAGPDSIDGLSIPKRDVPDVTPFLMFVGERHGQAEEAVGFYVSAIRNSRIVSLERRGGARRGPRATSSAPDSRSTGAR